MLVWRFMFKGNRLPNDSTTLSNVFPTGSELYNHTTCDCSRWMRYLQISIGSERHSNSQPDQTGVRLLLWQSKLRNPQPTSLILTITDSNLTSVGSLAANMLGQHLMDGVVSINCITNTSRVKSPDEASFWRFQTKRWMKKGVHKPISDIYQQPNAIYIADVGCTFRAAFQWTAPTLSAPPALWAPPLLPLSPAHPWSNVWRATESPHSLPSFSLSTPNSNPTSTGAFLLEPSIIEILDLHI